MSFSDVLVIQARPVVYFPTVQSGPVGCCPPLHRVHSASARHSIPSGSVIRCPPFNPDQISSRLPIVRFSKTNNRLQACRIGYSNGHKIRDAFCCLECGRDDMNCEYSTCFSLRFSSSLLSSLQLRPGVSAIIPRLWWNLMDELQATLEDWHLFESFAFTDVLSSRSLLVLKHRPAQRNAYVISLFRWLRMRSTRICVGPCLVS